MTDVNDQFTLGWARVADDPEYALLFLQDEIGRATKEKAFDTYTRYSAAGGCARQTAMEALGVDESDPNDYASLLNFRLGTIMHEYMQSKAVEKWGDDPETTALEIEKPSRHGDLTSGHSDLLRATKTDEGSKLTVVDWKSMGGFGFKAMIGGGREPEGPKMNYVKQIALIAEAEGCDEGRLSVISKEAVSPGQVKKFGLEELLPNRFPAVEFVFSRDQLAPLADAELKRIEQLKAVTDGGELPAATVPDLPKGAKVEAARWGTWAVRDADDDVVETGNYALCDYCNHQRTCHVLGPQRVEIGRIAEAREEGMSVENGTNKTTLKAIKMGKL